MRAFAYLLAFSVWFAWCGAASAQTAVPCQFLFNNLSRETVVLEELSAVQTDGSRKTYVGSITFKPGDYYKMSVGNELLEGHQLYYTIRLPDGTKRSMVTAHKEPYVVADGNYISNVSSDEWHAQLRAEDTARALNTGEKSYRYWNQVHAIFLEEMADLVQTISLWDLTTKIGGAMREIARRVDGLDTTDIDPDAVAAAHTLTGMLREHVKVIASRSILDVGVGLVELYNLKADTFSGMLNDNQRLAASSEDYFEFIKSRKVALEARYGYQLPYFTPPVDVGLLPFTFSQGYYVLVSNKSGDLMRNVKVRYHVPFADFNTQDVAERMDFDPRGGAITQLDPSKVGWTIDPAHWICITFDGGAYAIPAKMLIKR